MPSARQRALAAGEQFYRSGRACPNGHWGKRRTSTAKCMACEEDKRNQRIELQRKWYKENRTEHNTKSRNNHRKSREELIKAYGGKCDCCGEKATEFLCPGDR